MRKLLSVLLAFTLMLAILPMGMFGITVSAATTGNTGNCTWSLEGTVLTISGSGRMADYGSTTAPWGKDITEVIIKSGVTYIGASAFSNCTMLEKVTPSSKRKACRVHPE